jgi:[ribosomal protein S5]-alanine N-acetyltransferase
VRETAQESNDLINDKLRSFPTLCSARLVLREFVDADGDAIFDIFSSDEVTNTHNLSMRHREQGRRLAAWRRGLWLSGAGVRWAIAQRRWPRQAIGSCGFDFSRRDEGVIELSFDLHPSHWGQGLAREGVGQCVAHALEGKLPLSWSRIETLTLPDNDRARALLAALGFEDAGLCPSHRRWKTSVADLHRYVMRRLG